MTFPALKLVTAPVIAPNAIKRGLVAKNPESVRKTVLTWLLFYITS
jgi:hypothetical protein